MTSTRTPLFTQRALADPDFVPHQPLADITWLDCGMAGTMLDQRGVEHPMYFDDRCRNVARALLACYAEFGQDPIMLKGDPRTPAQEKWIWVKPV